ATTHTLVPYTTLFRSETYDWIEQSDNCLVYINGKRCRYKQYKTGKKDLGLALAEREKNKTGEELFKDAIKTHIGSAITDWERWRSEEHMSELQSRGHL